MDVGNPSNFVRMLDLYNHDFEALSKDITGYAFTDDETRQAMRDVYVKQHYVMDPHGAVGYLGLKKYQSSRKEVMTGIFLETAHPGKFRDVVEDTLQKKIELPATLKKFMVGTKVSIPISSEFEEFKSFLQTKL
jgi:threonine synthase